MNIASYVASVSFSLTLFYICYFLSIRKGNDFNQIRFFLVSSIILSLALPLLPINLDIPVVNTQNIIKPLNLIYITHYITASPEVKPVENNVLYQILIETYLFISLIFAGRFIFWTGKVFYYILKFEKQKNGAYTYVFINKPTVPFSFFHWIFISKPDKDQITTQIIEHESVHARQYHSIDIILSEIMVAAMWFNPFVWMYRNAIRQIHEFLADQGVINSGVDPLEYQSLLVNQAAEGKLIAISSPFSYSLIKKRLVMISEKKKSKHSPFKMLIILPLAAIVLMGVSIKPVYPDTIGHKMVKSDDSTVVEPISKDALIGQGLVLASPDGITDNSTAFRVVSFSVTVVIKGFAETEEQPNGPAFTKKQKDLIRKAPSGGKIYIENICARGPEGEIRNLGSIVFTIR